MDILRKNDYSEEESNPDQLTLESYLHTLFYQRIIKSVLSVVHQL